MLTQLESMAIDGASEGDDAVAQDRLDQCELRPLKALIVEQLVRTTGVG